MKKALIIVGILALVLYITSIVTGTHYIWKTLVYNYVDYDDYTIFENREIKMNKPQPWPDVSDSRDIDLTDSLHQFLTELETIGLLAIEDGSIIYEKYWDGYDQNTMANSFSVAKSYISALVGIALQEGKIKSLEDPITNYMPNLEGDHFSAITIKHLLTMSSGLEWIERYNMPINHTSESYYGTDLWGLVSGLEKLHKPGEVFHYKGSDPQLLSFVLKEATGQTVSDYLSEKIWVPTGSTQNALWSLDRKNGDEKAYCCINTNARSFARFGQLYLNHGKWNGVQILDSAYIAQSIQPHGIENDKGQKTDYYGYQWWCMDDVGKNVYYCRGLNGQYIFVFPESKRVVVRIGNKRKKGKGRHPVEVMKIVEWAENL